MKKVFLLSCLLLSAMLTFAQETKKVAILEVVDKEGNISYANKLILRSNLAKAITNTPGYEAYDRTDMDAILGEQNFQRTGMVSNDQIKRLGEMTGAKYVLVAEAAVVDANTMYIAAKLLDVETARTEVTDNQMMGTTAKEIQRGCQLLAENLIKADIVPHTYQKEAKSEKSATDKKKKTSEKAQSSPKSSSGVITKVSSNEYRIKGTKMDKKAYENFLYENCPEAWKKYKNGKNAVAAGWTFFGIGAAMQGGWALSVDADKVHVDDEDKWETAAVVIGSVGAGLAGIGLFTFIGGYASKAKALKIYNNKCANNSVSLNFKADRNGLGLAINF